MIDDGAFIAEMAAVFLGSGEMPCLSTTCPRKTMHGWENWHFSLFSVTPDALIRSKSGVMLLWDTPKNHNIIHVAQRSWKV